MNDSSRELLLNLSLKSAECLAEMCSFKLAEFHAHKAFHLAPHDMIVVDRAVRCCRPDVLENEMIFAASRSIWKACRRVHNILRGKILKRRLIIEKRKQNCATKINSFFRMVLTRNRTAGDRLSEVSIRRINILITSLAGKVLKKGEEIYWKIIPISIGLTVFVQEAIKLRCGHSYGSHLRHRSKR